ncbi:MAG TPA: hypothetical protein VIW47_11025 [Nitrospiraceae bacterium]|jgi:hypothetical protein
MDWLDIDLPADSPWFVAGIMAFWIMWAVFLVVWYKRTKAKGPPAKGKS